MAGGLRPPGERLAERPEIFTRRSAGDFATGVHEERIAGFPVAAHELFPDRFG